MRVLATARRSTPQPAAARRGPPQRAPRSARTIFFSASGGVFHLTRRKQRDLTDRAALEAVGLVHEYNLVTRKMFTRRSEFGEKSCAAAVGGGGGAHHDGRDACRLRGGQRSRCSCVVDRHHDRRGERQSSFPSFPVIFFHHVPQRQPLIATLGRMEKHGLRGRAIPMSPRLPRVLRARITTPVPLSAPLVGMSSSHVANF